MNLYLDQLDVNITLGAAKVNLPDLIQAAGHTCLVKQFKDLTMPDVGSIDRIVAQRQINYERYVAISFMKSNGLLQPELHMLDKWYAHRKLQELGLNYLNTDLVISREVIENFADDYVLLKPSMSMQSKSKLDFAYIPMSKQELLAKIDAVDIDLSRAEYIIQEGVTNSRPIIFVAGYVNPQGQIHIDGALKQWFSVNDLHFENKLRYPDRHEIQIEEVPLDELDEFYVESIRQIKVVLQHFNAACTPFCIQAIVDDDNEVQLMDFNFGFGKVYSLHLRSRTPEYIIDRIRYTYGGADSIPPNNTYMLNVLFDTPNGITDEIKAYVSGQPTMYIGFGRTEKDEVTENVNAPPTVAYHGYRSGCVILASSRAEAYEVRDNFLAFLATLN